MKPHALIAAAVAIFLFAAPLQAYSPLRGEPFFLLSDASYAPEAEAMVRLEATSLWAVAEYGGVDVRVYRVPKPLEFLQRQKNLHRVDVAGIHAGEGLSNALSRVWDKWWLQSRLAWRKLFTSEARSAVTAQAPGTKTHPQLGRRAPESLHPQYAPLKGFELAESFRYPVQVARPIAPPAGVKLAGSSSEFIKVQQGNVMIPLGRRAPGLYLVEALLGEHRALTLVFVSSTVAVTKVSADQMLAWVTGRDDGRPVANANVVWTDGVGVLQKGATEAGGLAIFSREAPEKTYVFGEDPAGGVFISENYYYDSEIYNTRLYAVTDRPLYRPGDEVFVKFLGRELRSARETRPAAPAELDIAVFDPGGFPVATQKARFASEAGASTSFRLPDNASAGGYELRFQYQGDTYGAAFRVADYVKPHFEIGLVADKREYKTGDAVSGRLQLSYPDGKPVPGAKVELGVRAQRLSMVEGDLGYSGQFALKLINTSLVTDANGIAAFSLPPASEPSRYVLTALATDGAAYRVRTTKELLIERGAGLYALAADKSFSAPKETVRFAIRAINAHGAAPESWESIRLEDRKRETGSIAERNSLSLSFAEPGSYTVNLRDAGGNIVGAASHWVSGDGMKAPQGTIEIVLDRGSYRPGDTANALITFPEPVEHALLTLERDRVEKTALLAAGANWLKTTRVTPTQWRAALPVGEDLAPNITLSVAYVKHGEYAFQNQGLRVEQPKIDVRVKADKTSYAPGETVKLELAATAGGKPAAGARLTVSVVDEMIYLLQPEIAPDIFEFFYHPRRNNVRTSASLAFIGYDLARPRGREAAPTRRQAPERAVKVLERPRREDTDTALWQPDVVADGEGRARLEFRMPDSLTRWRVTARAMNAEGVVGQSVAHLRSDKALYLKWASPNWLRASDAPIASLAVFNQGTEAVVAELNAKGAGLSKIEKLTLKPGANFVRLPLDVAGGDSTVSLSLAAGGATVDALSVPLKSIPLHWAGSRSQTLGAGDALTLPPDAANIAVRFTDSAAAHFRRVMDDLIDFPHGCVEQTASRLIPYSLAVQSLGAGEERLAPRLVQQLHTQRFRLAQFAGPKAVFGWWSAPDKAGDALLTAYAYYADWHASRALGLAMPAGHWDRLLEVYRSEGTKRSHWHRALMLSWMQEMGLPVRSMAAALADELGAKPPSAAMPRGSRLDSAVLGEATDESTDPMTRLLAAYLVQQAQAPLPPRLAATLPAASNTAHTSGTPLAQALLLMTKRAPLTDAPRVLQDISAEMATMDRALALLWIHRALGGKSPRGADAKATLAAPWLAIESATGQAVYRLPRGVAPPATLAVVSAAPAGTQALLTYESREPQQTKLPLSIERRIWRLKRIDAPAKPAPKPPAARAGQPAEPAPPSEPVATAAEYALERVDPGSPLKTDEVYLDEIVLRPKPGAKLRYGLVEVALPPGASADRSTWGIAVKRPGNDEATALERARFETTPTGYSFPVEELSGEMVVSHLLRVAQAGRYALPPVRYTRMYQPEDKAFEENPRARIDVR